MDDEIRQKMKEHWRHRLPGRYYNMIDEGTDPRKLLERVLDAINIESFIHSSTYDVSFNWLEAPTVIHGSSRQDTAFNTKAGLDWLNKKYINKYDVVPLYAFDPKADTYHYHNIPVLTLSGMEDVVRRLGATYLNKWIRAIKVISSEIEDVLHSVEYEFLDSNDL